MMFRFVQHPRLQEENERLKTQLARVKSELVKERKAVQEAIPTAHILGDEARRSLAARAPAQ